MDVGIALGTVGILNNYVNIYKNGSLFADADDEERNKKSEYDLLEPVTEKDREVLSIIDDEEFYPQQSQEEEYNKESDNKGDMTYEDDISSSDKSVGIDDEENEFYPHNNQSLH